MEAIREIVSADILSPIINLYWKSKGLQVVIPIEEEKKRQRIDFRKLKGRLKEYALQNNLFFLNSDTIFTFDKKL